MADAELTRLAEACTPPNNYTCWTQATAVSPDGRLVATCTVAQAMIWYTTAGNLAGGPFGIIGVILCRRSAACDRILGRDGAYAECRNRGRPEYICRARAGVV